MAKKKPVVIKTPYPTVEQVRKELGVSKKRAKEIKKMMDEIFDLVKREKIKNKGDR